MKKILILMLVLFAFTYGQSEKTIKYNLNDYPYTYDPQSNTDTSAGDILSYIFEGLTRLDSKGNPVPAVAESWTNKGNTWTFKLRKTAKWHNGEIVMAKDFVNAWERALNPNTEAEYSYIMYCIKGAQEYNEGTFKSFSSVGVKALDNFTLQVTLKEPVVYFPSLVSFYTFYPQNSNFLKSLKTSNYGDSARDILGNGAFEVKKTKNLEDLSLVKSKNYWNKDKISVDNINFSMLNSEDIIGAYEDKKIDITNLDDENFNKYKDSKNVKTYEDGSVWYLSLNNDNYLFSNKKIRNAFAMAIDREAFVKDVKNGLASVAESVIPLGIKGKKDFFRNEYSKLDSNISYNPEKAKKLFEEGLKELGLEKSELDPITLLSGNTKMAIADGEFIVEQLNNNLGINIVLESVAIAERYSKTLSGDYEITISGWGPDYNDPMTYLDMWTSDSQINGVRWHNEGYDALIAEAKTETDLDKRMDLLAQAEEMLINETPIVPIYFRKKAALISSNVDKVDFNLFSPTVNFVYTDK